MLKANLQFFARKPAVDLAKQNNKQLLKGIKSNLKNIKVHEEKISNPMKYYPNWNELSSKVKQGHIKHWKKEIANFKQSIHDSTNIIKRRKNNENK
ncbi:MAG: hypothetical protein GYA87_03750 [Christensenellaceae bacterium]|nr:hypothetical protein [Christensenellaceae bacterium]